MNKDSRIFVAGHRGMVGSAIVRALEERGYKQLITRTSAQLDLRDQPQVKELFEKERPEFVLLAAAKVGGIMANNTFRADFLYDNLMIEANVIHQAYLHKVKKLLFLGSSCIYPKLAPQPLKEEYLLTGELEQTNEPYAIAKITGIKLVESYRRQYGCNFISGMPTNLYGPNDNYDLNKSHVLPALLRKFHTAKAEGLPEVQIWGTGTPLREFLHVDDLAEACLFMMDNYDEELFLNIGTGQDLSIRDLAEMIKDIVGYEGQLRFDTTKPDGTPRKLLDVSKIKAIGWSPRISLADGIKKVYEEEVRHAVFVEQP